MTPDPVEVWLIAADLPGPVIAALESLLDEPERRRAAAIAGERARHRYIAAHAAARSIIADRLGVPAATLRWQRGRHGKPELAGDPGGLRFNLSHSDDLAVLAVTARRPLGVDIQRLTPHLDPAGLAARFFPEPEARAVAAAVGPEQLERFVRLWVRKEACVKALGERLMRFIHLPVDDDAPADGVVVRDPRGRAAAPLRVCDIPVPPGFQGAVALTGTDHYGVVMRRWTAPAVAGI